MRPLGESCERFSRAKRLAAVRLRSLSETTRDRQSLLLLLAPPPTTRPPPPPPLRRWWL